MSTRNRRARRPEPRHAKPDLALRRRLLVGVLSSAFVVLSAAVFYRQVVETDYLRSEGERRYLRVGEIAARRGMITDRNGEPLAVSTPVETVWGEPRKLVERRDAIPPLAVALGLEPKELQERLDATSERGFLYLKRRVSFEEARAVRQVIADHDLAGVDFETEYRRFYPGVEVFGHVLGFTDIDDSGQEGIELTYDSWLKSEPGLRRVIRDGRQQIVQEIEQVRAPSQGADLALSLDRRLQFLAYRELKAAVAEHKAVGGTLVALDVETGEILAMVNQPGYNPNAQRGGSSERRRNRAVTDVMEPGSTIKPFVVAAALERGLIKPTTTIATRGGSLAVGSNTVKDVRNYGNLDVTGVITKSSNVGVVKIAQMMSYGDLWGLYDQLGFGHATDVGVPGESRGVLRHHSTWRVFEHATQAFGYGLSVTALQLAQAYGVLAADGVKRPVSLLRRDPASPVPAGEETRVLSAETARKVRAMMETVVSDQGTAKRAAITGYRVAGKTGTAKKSAGRAGYGGGRYQAVFAGFAPAGSPRLVIAVMIDEPKGKAYYGGLVAAPVFQKVMEGALRLFNVPPDDPQPSMLLARREVKP
ncbi:peptidoglycan D,D-transpeptidase FtsI family protein [Thiocapsa roseopersicina]|uniref:Peptidoglycan D,D-transpeptidase FtsI n=1 Tax=Thiocapsa roseopersicina TaxID=1058 RepID=A0A1H2YPR3_THIRO|nr:penicillin-binding transpeptidase domain-containing protein [Thiocapsa roseopersicina]SDX07005.1 peptidoglycan synthetase FtsI [Thiocapsa roseopersicina]